MEAAVWYLWASGGPWGSPEVTVPHTYTHTVPRGTGGIALR